MPPLMVALMTENRFLPIAGIITALVTGVVMLIAGTNPWLAVAAVLKWGPDIDFMEPHGRGAVLDR